MDVIRHKAIRQAKRHRWQNDDRAQHPQIGLSVGVVLIYRGPIVAARVHVAFSCQVLFGAYGGIPS